MNWSSENLLSLRVLVELDGNMNITLSEVGMCGCLFYVDIHVSVL